MTISVIVCNIGVLLDAIYKLLISFVLPEEIRCEYQVYKPQYIFAMRSLHTGGGMGLALSTFFLAAERTLATITYVTYEQNVRRWVGIALAVVQILLCLPLSIRTSPPPQFYPYVTPYIGNSERTIVFGNILVGINIFALLVYTTLYLVNRRRRRFLSDSHLRVLSIRFQLRENIATTRLMTPVMAVVTIMTTSAQWVFYTYLPILNRETVVTSKVLEQVTRYAPYGEFQLSMMPVLALLLVLLLPCFNLHIKRSFVRISHLKMCFPEDPPSIDTVTAEQARDLYFAKLKGQCYDNAVPRAQL
ncbi:hypothetical protein RB195_021360 [Necator americanus]